MKKHVIELINVGEYTLKNLTLEEKAELTTGGSYWTSAQIKARGVDSVRFSDGPAGLRPQGNKGDNLGNGSSLPATCFPAHSALACSWNKELCFGVGKRIGEEAKYYGADVLLAPDINIKRHPLCGRNFEYFSEDPFFNGKLGAAYANGVQSAGAFACLKHFAANNREFGRMVCDSVIDERTLREIYLTGFEIAVKESRPAAVMAAYNKLNGVYCFENEYLLGGILRGEWSFDGLVISDWGGTSGRAAAVSAGGDLEMPPCRFSPDEVVRAVEDGTLKESKLDESVKRLTALSEKCSPAAESCDFGEHGNYAKACADECVVLLKNDGTLPLNGGRIAVIGDIAKNPVIQGGGSSKVNPESAVSLLSCLKDVAYERGYKKRGASRKLERRALSLCAKVDTVIFCAGVYDGDSEGADRESYSLPVEQVRLLENICKLGKKVVVVLFCGCAVDTFWDKNVNGLLYAGLAGQSGARSVADILIGKVNPSGKLSETFPEKLSDLPADKDFNKDAYCEVYGEGMNVGYRAGISAKYPFGFGLSYTGFSYSDLNVTAEGVTFKVTNTGNVSGGEAAQMYVRFPESANTADIQLKGFKKVFLGAGESAEVKIAFDEYTFRSYDVAQKGWKKVTGEYGILINSSSADVKLSGTLTVEGDTLSVAPCKTDILKTSEYTLQRDKKGRIIADIHTPLCELKNAKGLLGRLFARISLLVVKNRRTVHGSMRYLPMRTMAQYGGMKRKVIDGLIRVFNGKFFKGK